MDTVSASYILATLTAQLNTILIEGECCTDYFHQCTYTRFIPIYQKKNFKLLNEEPRIEPSVRYLRATDDMQSNRGCPLHCSRKYIKTTGLTKLYSFPAYRFSKTFVCCVLRAFPLFRF